MKNILPLKNLQEMLSIVNSYFKKEVFHEAFMNFVFNQESC